MRLIVTCYLIHIYMDRVRYAIEWMYTIPMIILSLFHSSFTFHFLFSFFFFVTLIVRRYNERAGMVNILNRMWRKHFLLFFFSIHINISMTFTCVCVCVYEAKAYQYGANQQEQSTLWQKKYQINNKENNTELSVPGRI